MMVLLGRTLVCSHRLSIQTTVVSGTVWPQFAMQVLTQDYQPPVWGKGDRRGLEMGHLSSSVVTSYRLPIVITTSLFPRCFAVLCQLRQIHHSVPIDAFQTMVVSLANSFGLWQQCPDWPSCLLGPMTPVSAERGCAVDLSPAAIRPHLRRAGLPRLAARP